jgi:hypothetical protein
MSGPLRVVHYVNPFFGASTAEEQAGVGDMPGPRLFDSMASGKAGE